MLATARLVTDPPIANTIPFAFGGIRKQVLLGCFYPKSGLGNHDLVPLQLDHLAAGASRRKLFPRLVLSFGNITKELFELE